MILRETNKQNVFSSFFSVAAKYFFTAFNCFSSNKRFKSSFDKSAENHKNLEFYQDLMK